MEIPAKCVAATVLLLHIAVGIGVISLVVSKEHHEHRKTSEILKQQFSRIYTEHLEKSQATFTNAGTNKTQPRTPADLLNLLKPIAYFPGLDLTGYKEADTSVDTPIRNWVPFIGPGRQLLYNGMKYENGSIVVPATGLTKVVLVSIHDKSCYLLLILGIFFKAVCMYVCMYVYTIEPRCFSYTENDSNDTRCIQERTYKYKLGAKISGMNLLMQMDVGDQLMVKVSRMNPLRHDRDWQYFGVHFTRNDMHGSECRCNGEHSSVISFYRFAYRWRQSLQS
ncbi:uncharacterized protein LOC124274994 [Haliotis rubra]|uniref:uncharacterized protein LOC124274994 n=1 Tax=Haliotis rubra TaxID=36100 RepID=UPI001EE5D8D4|nr:uncharacterized protein LOC124274994 [Haliotis rubra]